MFRILTSNHLFTYSIWKHSVTRQRNYWYGSCLDNIRKSYWSAMLKMYKLIHYSFSVCTEWMMLLIELGVFYRDCLLSWCLFLIGLTQSAVIRTSPHPVIYFSLKAILLFQHTECLEKCCQISQGFLLCLGKCNCKNLHTLCQDIFCTNTVRA